MKIKIFVLSCLLTSGSVLAGSNTTVTVLGDRMVNGNLLMKLDAVELPVNKNKAPVYFWRTANGEVVLGKYIHVSPRMGSTLSACVTMLDIANESQTQCSESVVIDQELRDGQAPAISDLRFNTLPIENETVNIQYTFTDPDCHEDATSEYCGEEDKSKMESSWSVNSIEDINSKDKSSIQVAVPENWNWAVGDQLPLKVVVTAFSNDDGGVGLSTSNTLDFETSVLRDFTGGDNIISVPIYNFFRPALLSDTTYTETNIEVIHTSNTSGFDWSGISQDKGITHCDSLGMSLVSKDELLVLLESKSAPGTTPSILTANWPLGVGMYLTRTSTTVGNNPRVVAYDVQSSDGSFNEKEIHVRSIGLVVCVKPDAAKGLE